MKAQPVLFLLKLSIYVILAVSDVNRALLLNAIQHIVHLYLILKTGFAQMEKDERLKKPRIIGVMGGSVADEADAERAYRLGQLIAENGWVLLNGGRRAGIMDASARGAAEAGCITIGILPDDRDHPGVSEHIQIPIFTGMGNARNVINVLTSHVIVACPGGAGTLSEIALALKVNKPVILLQSAEQNRQNLEVIGQFTKTSTIFEAESPESVIEIIHRLWAL